MRIICKNTRPITELTALKIEKLFEIYAFLNELSLGLADSPIQIPFKWMAVHHFSHTSKLRLCLLSLFISTVSPHINFLLTVKLSGGPRLSLAFARVSSHSKNNNAVRSSVRLSSGAPPLTDGRSKTVPKGQTRPPFPPPHVTMSH